MNASFAIRLPLPLTPLSIVTCAVLVTLTLSNETLGQFRAAPVEVPRGARPTTHQQMAWSSSVQDLPIPYASFVGGTGQDIGVGMYVTDNDDIIFSMMTTSPGLPTSEGAFQSELADPAGDIYIIRFRPETAEMVWATYFGSEAVDYAFDMDCADRFNMCYIFGSTYGDLPGATAKASTVGSDAYALGFNMEDGDIAWLNEFALELDAGFNGGAWCPDYYLGKGPSDNFLATFGFRQTATTGLDQEICLLDPLTGQGSCTVYEEPGDQSLYTGQCLETGLLGVGFTDQTQDDVFSPDADPLVSTMLNGELWVWHAAADAVTNWADDVACGKDFCVVTAYQDNPPNGETHTWCLNTSTQCTAEDYQTCTLDPESTDCLPTCLPRTHPLAPGRANGVSIDETNTTWIVQPRFNTDNQFTGLTELAFTPNRAPFCTSDMLLSVANPLPFGVVLVDGYDATPYFSSWGGTAFGGFLVPPANAYQTECEGSATCGSPGITAPNALGWMGLNTDLGFWSSEIRIQNNLIGQFDLDFTESSGFWMLDADASVDIQVFEEGETPVPITNADFQGNNTLITIIVPDGHFNIPLDITGPSFILVNATLEELVANLEAYDDPPTGGPLDFQSMALPAMSASIYIPKNSVRARQRRREKIKYTMRLLDNNEIPQGDWSVSHDLLSVGEILLGVFFPTREIGGKSHSEHITFRVVDGAGAPVETVVTTATEDASVPSFAYSLGRNYPNPFSNETLIPVELGAGSLVGMEVFNVLGQRVGTIDKRLLPPGQHELRFDASQLRPGVYVYTVTVDGHASTGTMMVDR